jgi:hypothetical protein
VPVYYAADGFSHTENATDVEAANESTTGIYAEVQQPASACCRRNRTLSVPFISVPFISVERALLSCGNGRRDVLMLRERVVRIAPC